MHESPEALVLMEQQGPAHMPAVAPTTGAALTFGGRTVARLIAGVPRVRGAWKLGSALARRLPPRARSAALAIEAGGHALSIDFDLGDEPQFTMVHLRHLDEGVVALLAALLRPGDTFVDVGANWGYFTAVASRLVGASGTILSVEPNPRAFRSLLATVWRHAGPSVLCVNQPASDRAGKPVALVRPCYRQTTGTHLRDVPAGGRADAVTCTVDDLVGNAGAGRVTLLKVDAEGSDLAVLRGASGLLRGQRPWVIAEAQPMLRRYGDTVEDLYRYMRDLNYTPYAFDPGPDGPALADPSVGPTVGEVLFAP